MDIDRLGPYQIVGQLGRGGMGTVYEGVHRETGEPAAIKLLSAALAQEEGFRVRFETEIETLRKLNHPNIVRLFGFGQQEDHLFYSMELVDGNSLEEELRRGRHFDWREVTRIGVEMCRALRHAHDRGVIHRDIKPGNVLMSADGRVKLSDFGIARLFGYSHLTSAGNVLGTAEYMAPEQADGRPVDARADLYSLGALMYALLARRPVFRGKSLVEVLHKQRFEQPEPLRKHASDAPEELERILGQLLEKDPARRIPNAGILGRRLEAMLHALRANPETVEADADWFLNDEPSPALLPEDAPLAPTIDRPVAALPATQALQPSVERPRETGPEKPRREPLLGNSSAAESPSTQMVPDAASPTRPGRFIPVGEDELDQAEEEESRPAISWQTGALAGALLAVGLSVWWFLQPPTADALYNRIAAQMDGNSTNSHPLAESDIDEAKNHIDDFLTRYSEDPRAGRLREYVKKLDLDRLDRKCERFVDQRINNRPASHEEDLSPIAQMYLDAISDLRFDPARGMAKLQALTDLCNHTEGDTGPTGQYLALAQRRLARLRKELEKHANDQLALLRERLDAADAMRQSDPKQARAIYRAVVELYGERPWAAEVVRRARESLDTESTRRKP